MGSSLAQRVEMNIYIYIYIYIYIKREREKQCPRARSRRIVERLRLGGVLCCSTSSISTVIFTVSLTRGVNF